VIIHELNLKMIHMMQRSKLVTHRYISILRLVKVSRSSTS